MACTHDKERLPSLLGGRIVNHLHWHFGAAVTAFVPDSVATPTTDHGFIPAKAFAAFGAAFNGDALELLEEWDLDAPMPDVPLGVFPPRAKFV